MADATIRPVSAGTGNWDVTTVANINEAITQPSTAGDGTYARHHGSSTKIQEWNLTAPSDAGTITGVVVWMRVSCAEFGDNEMSVRIKTNGTWHSLSCTSDPFLSDIEEWKSYTGTFSGGAMVGSAPVLEVTGTGSSSSSRGYLHNAYGLLAYTPAPSEQYAVKSGNWNDSTVWSTGAVPTTGAVYANGYTVTVNVNATCTSVNTIAGSVAVAGGGFTLANGVTLTANAYSGSTTCVTFSGTSGNSASFVGTAYGSSTTVNKWGIYNSSTGTLNITGSPTGGSQTNAYGAWSGSTGTINVTGSPVGGTGSGAAGVRAATGTINIIGSPTGGAATGGAGVYLTGSSGGTVNGNPIGATGTGVWHSSSGTLAITGSVTGGTAGAASAGVLNDGSGTVTISGDATGGSNVLAYGASNTGTGTLTVAGKAISGVAAGVASLSGSGYATVGSVETGSSGVSPCIGHVHVANLNSFTALVRSSSSSVTLSAEVGLPSPFEPSPVFGGA